MENNPNLRSRLNDLHKNLPQTDTRALKDKIEKGEIGRPEQSHMKLEVNAITALFIEEIWTKAVQDLQGTTSGLMDKDNNVLLEEEILKSINNKWNSRAVVEFLRESTARFLIKHLYEWSEMREKGILNPITKDDIKSRAYLRLKSLLRTHGYRENEEGDKSPRFHILRGMNTAVFTIWETCSILPQVYKDQFSKPIPREEFIKQTKTSLPLIYNLAGSHLDVFNAITPHFTWEIPELEQTGFSSAAFHFSGGPDDLKLELNKSVTGDAKLPQVVTEPRTGCPAMFSSGPKGKNVIAEMSDWIFELAEKYYLPVLEKEGLVV